MTPPDDAATPGSSEAAQAAERRIPLPAAAPPEPGRGASGAAPTRLDALLVVMLLILAFFLGSIAAHNTDVWMHLATGRLIAWGEYQFGSDPFSYTTSGLRWVNTSWLSDLLGYVISNAFGGPDTPRGGGVLVALKAVLIAAMAAVLLSIRRAGQSVWPGVVCVCLGLLAMSPRLLLQPACISYFLLAVTVYLLFRSLPESDAAGAGSARSLWFLPPLFVLWVNLDNWFLLGPVTVALFLIGEALQGRGGRRLGAVGLTLIVGLLACLLNPFHVHVFALPPDLAVAFNDSPLRSEPMFQVFYLSPLQGAFYHNSIWMPYAGGIAFLALAALGVLSFMLNTSNWQWWRVLLWLPFFLLSLYLARAIPFFAVVAAPITALNLYDFALGRSVSGATAGGWAVAGRVVTLVGLVILAVLDWPGWLHMQVDPSVSHRVAWRLAVDPSLANAARDLAELRTQDVLRKHGFHLSPDVPNYCAWFCPAEKGFFDYRFHLFGKEIAQQYIDLRRALVTPARPAEEGEGAAGQAPVPKVFEDVYGIDHVVVSNAAPEATKAFYARFILDPDRQWTLLWGDGRTEIFGWSPAPTGPDAERFARHKLAPDQQAFRVPLPADEKAPEAGAPAPRPRTLWQDFVAGPPRHSPAVGKAEMYLNYFDVEGLQDLRRRNEMVVASSAVGALPGVLAPGAVSRALVVYSANMPMLVWAAPERASSAPLYLAVRAARRAVAADPNDAQAWLTLGQATYVLWNYQRTRYPTSARLNELREVQVVSALSYAVALRPDLREAHSLLASVFFNMTATRPNGRTVRSHLDLWLEHTKEFLRLVRAAGPTPGESPEDFEKRLAAEDENVSKYEQFLQQQRDDFELRSKNPRYEQVTDRADLALERGLAKTAIEILERADKSQLQRGEVIRLFALLLRSGRIDTVRELEEYLTEPSLKFLYAAALGDYGRADEYIQEIITALDRARLESLFTLFRSNATPPFPLPGQEYLRSFLRLGEAANLTSEWADWLSLRGLMALEVGDNAGAERAFRQALALTFSARQPAAMVGLLSARGPLEATALLERQIYAVAGNRLRFTTERMAAHYANLIKQHASPVEAAQTP